MTGNACSASRVLVVDDNPTITRLLHTYLTSEGYEVEVIGDGLEVVEAVHRRRPDLILLDLDLPHLSGDEICRRLKSQPSTRLIPIIMITDFGASTNRVAAWDYGADEFIPKPFPEREVLMARCRSLLRIKRLVEERDSAEAVVFALARAVEAKSPFTLGHSERVAHMALRLAATVGVEAEERETLYKGALLHDIGKISIPDAILNKPTTLTVPEYDTVKQHTITGAHIVEPLMSVRDSVGLIRWHHERLDGMGYPDGLRGEQIPVLVRLLSICDIYDSLASDRPYRQAIPHDTCLNILRENARGGGLDVDLVEGFAGLFTRSELCPPGEGQTKPGENGAAPSPARADRPRSEPPA